MIGRCSTWGPSVTTIEAAKTVSALWEELAEKEPGASDSLMPTKAVACLAVAFDNQAMDLLSEAAAGLLASLVNLKILN